MELHVGVNKRAVVVDGPPHCYQRGADCVDVRRRTAGGRTFGGSRFDQAAQLDKVLEQVRRHTLRWVPGQHVRIEEIPGRSRQNVRSGAATRGDEAFGGKDLESLADCLAAYAELGTEIGLAWQERAFPNVALGNPAPDLVSDLPMQGS
jgi:hypothetical protein